MLRSLAFFCLLSAVPTAALAAVTVDIFQGKVVVVKENGENVERVEPVDSVVPGDTVVYRYTVYNDAERPVADVKMRATVPEVMTYVDHSAATEGWSVMVSHDSETHAPEGELVIYEIDETSRPAKTSDIRYLRWSLDGEMEPGARRVVEFRAILNR